MYFLFAVDKINFRFINIIITLQRKFLNLVYSLITSAKKFLYSNKKPTF